MIILASQSQARKQLLERAGVPFRAISPDFDEVRAKKKFSGYSAADLATELATGKAMTVSRTHLNDVIIGADQILECGGTFFNKPLTKTAARQQLKALRGKSHTLTSAIVCVTARTRIWHHVSTARITLRQFSDTALDDYLDAAGKAILSSVGSYHYEGIGIRLMDAVRGDDHTILGFPMLPLMRFLRRQGLLPS